MSAAASRREAKRRQITEAARTLFLAQGFAGTSMDAVTAEAGVSKQTLYAYFPTKVDLLAAVLFGAMSELQLHPPHPVRPETREDLRQSMVGFATMLIATLLRPDTIALIRLVLGEAFRVPELRAAVREALPGQVLDRTRTILRDVDARGVIRVRDVDLAARMFIGPVMTYVALDGFLSADPSPAPDTDRLAALVEGFLAAVEALP